MCQVNALARYLKAHKLPVVKSITVEVSGENLAAQIPIIMKINIYSISFLDVLGRQ